MHGWIGPSALAALFVFTSACSSESSKNQGAGGAAGSGTGGASGAAGAGGSAAAPGWQLGEGDGSPSSVKLTTVYQPQGARSATDLAFHPTRDELWVLLRERYEGEPCTSTDKTGCASNEGSVAIVSGATGAAPTAKWKQDPNAWHFMRRPTAIAFGVDDTFATCGEARSANLEDDPTPYMGVTWWSSDPTIFAIQEPGQNGSHLDMLHATPFGMGVAHQSDAVYWAFNGDAGAIDKYDFKSPHEPGGADHSDGEIYRYVLGQVARMPEVPSHLTFDSARKTLYIADTGNHRVVSLDTAAGIVASDQFEVFDPVQAHDYVELVGLVDVVPPGTLEAPSGIEWFADLLFVTDNASSRIHAFDLTGKLVRTLETGLPPRTLAGVTVGPDKKVYFVDMLSGEVRRIDPI
ncbi:MAG: hypothetical protein HYZ29_33060 [Myxococcales bacterium]|nr:hypothetical protein [Myxococcales bacterium]